MTHYIDEHDFIQIYTDFFEWVNGLVEDDPIPYEINCLVFYINENFEIGFSGFESESINVVEFGPYFPLESEYFYSKRLISILNSNKENKRNYVLKLLKEILIKFQQDDYKNIFLNRKIYYGLLFHNANLLKFDK